MAPLGSGVDLALGFLDREVDFGGLWCSFEWDPSGEFLRFKERSGVLSESTGDKKSRLGVEETRECFIVLGLVRT